MIKSEFFEVNKKVDVSDANENYFSAVKQPRLIQTELGNRNDCYLINSQFEHKIDSGRGEEVKDRITSLSLSASTELYLIKQKDSEVKE